MASERLVVWFDVLSGSRYQSWAWTVAPIPGFFMNWEQLGHHRALKSIVKRPSHSSGVPVPSCSPVRRTGGSTHWKLVPLPQEFAWRPFVPKKKSPALSPSTPLARTEKPVVLLALGMPLAESAAWQPLAEIPAVQ